MFAEMVRVHNRRIDREDYRSGILHCVIRQIVGDKKASWRDPFEREKPNKPKTTPFSVMLARAKAYNTALETEGRLNGN
jgi:hypothetical protein